MTKQESINRATKGLIPELVESNGEQIRNWICGIIESLGEPADEDAERELNIMQPLALAWLEKQKEQPQVDLEKELDRYLRGEFQQTAGGNFNNYIQVARHFYELGKSRKEK